MPRRSIRIHACEAAVSADDFPPRGMEVSESDRLWCCCGGRDNSQLMYYFVISSVRDVVYGTIMIV